MPRHWRWIVSIQVGGQETACVHRTLAPSSCHLEQEVGFSGYIKTLVVFVKRHFVLRMLSLGKGLQC